MMRVVRSSVVSMWKRPPAVTSMVLPPRDHSMCLASPEKAQATVRTLPGSMLMSSGRASILGAEPGEPQWTIHQGPGFVFSFVKTTILSVKMFKFKLTLRGYISKFFNRLKDSVSPIALNEDPSVRLLELSAYDSDATVDMLDMDMVSNFISAAMLLKELDSIMDDIMACWEEEEKEEDSSIVWISFFIMDELMADEDSL